MLLTACLFLLPAFIGTGKVLAAVDVCGAGVSMPPFLSAGVDANLMIILDNSASMYDLGYVDGRDPGSCFDDTYNTAASYAGYFETDPVDRWYVYNFATRQFEGKATEADARGVCATASATDSEYSGTDVCVAIEEPAAPAPHSVTAFAARGNLLNWAASSKFDIEKRILTGGKFDSPDNQLVMESRGCLARRFIKQVPVQDPSSGAYFLALGVKPPVEENFSRWKPGTIYARGDIVSYEGALYKSSIGGRASGATINDDTAPGWILYNVTQIEIFPVTTTGFDNTACDALVDEMSEEDGADLGDMMKLTDACMDHTNNSGNVAIGNEIAVFNHALQTCWSIFTKPDKVEGPSDLDGGDIARGRNVCKNTIYDAGIDPGLITTDSPASVCRGLWPNYLSGNKTGYLGRCWEPARGADGKGGWTDDVVDYNGDGSISGEETDAPGDACVRQALWDYCTNLQVPEVIDPTDQSSVLTTSEMWNLSAVLADSAILAQVGRPIAAMQGVISQVTAPTNGLIQEYARDLRIGIMAFNREGSFSECRLPDPHILYHCSPDNQDGAEVLVYIDQDVSPATTHQDALVDAINGSKATSWTPLAEAMYTAIGYYGQRQDRRLNSIPSDKDFEVESENPAHPDPIIAHCQGNNILIITDGASTADLNGKVDMLARTAGLHDGDIDPMDCGSLQASTLLDDLAWFAWNGNPWDIYDSETLIKTKFTDANSDPAYKQNIKSYFVLAGSPRSGKPDSADRAAYPSGLEDLHYRADLANYNDDECNADILLNEAAEHGGTKGVYEVSDISVLKETLRAAFNAVRAGPASGSAASVISAARGGEGAVYQAIFWPNIDVPSPGTDVQWVGEVHALLVDAQGFTHEDIDGDTNLNPGVDKRIVIYFDEEARSTRACEGPVTSGICKGTSKSLFAVKYLWSATEWLAGINDADILSNRTDFISGTENKRYIFTWNDLDNDGIVDSGEVLDFDSSTDWAGKAVSGGRGDVPNDFGPAIATNADVNNIVNWVRGLDGLAGQRSRKVPYDMDKDGASETDITWRLGDVVHSTPMVVSRPSEGYHLLYRDMSYGLFVNKYNNRRTMVYFGGNDGMLHAVNGGFYNVARKGFCRSNDCANEAGNPELGAELWAYIPYNLIPHLECATRPGYTHKYFVDQRPRIFDVQLFTEEAECSTNGIDDPACMHPNGWGTILVGAMRFGGAPVRAAGLNGLAGTDNRVFTSAYFIMDITDPEKPPVLLGEMTNTGAEVNLGYTTAIPTIVPMKDGFGTKWYLVMGSGPTNIKGESDQLPRLGILPLEWLTGATKRPFRISAAPPTVANSEGGSFELTASRNGFVSDLVTVDFELDANYKADVVYFGTVENGFGNWGGKLYRMVTREHDAGNFVATTPSAWNDGNHHPLNIMFDAGAPITAAPSVATDGRNHWVYFGTGRFYDREDKTDNSTENTPVTLEEVQTYYGLKEPYDCASGFSWNTLQKTGDHALQSAVYPVMAGEPGTQGLLRVDQIRIYNAPMAELAGLICEDDTMDCLPCVDGTYPADCAGPRTATFEALKYWIAGTGCDVTITPAQHTGADGWYREMRAHERERNLGQSTVLGGLVSYTTYQPYDNPCLPEGLGYLYAVHYQTGTASYRSVFNYESESYQTVPASSNSRAVPQKVPDSIALGRGLPLTPNLHVGADGVTAIVQTSIGEVKRLRQEKQAIENYKTGKTGWREGELPAK